MLEEDNSGMRESNVSGYATGNDRNDNSRNAGNLPRAAEFEICEVSPDKLNARSNKVQHRDKPHDKSGYVGTDVMIKGENSELEPENLDDSRENEQNTNVLFNQNNFLRDMQGYQQASGEDLDSARKLTFGAKRKD